MGQLLFCYNRGCLIIKRGSLSFFDSYPDHSGSSRTAEERSLSFLLQKAEGALFLFLLQKTEKLCLSFYNIQQV